LKYLQRINNLFLILTLFISTFKLVAQPNPVPVDKIIAKVDNYIVLKSDLEEIYMNYLQNGEKVDGDTKCRLLESLILNKLLVARADIDSVVVDSKQVEEELSRRMQYYISQFGSEQKIEEIYKTTISEFKNEVRPQIREQLLVQQMQRNITEKISMTPGEVKKFFSAIPRDSVPYFDTEAEVGQIVKKPTVAKVQKYEVKERLQKVRDRIIKGEDFATLAKEFSEDYGSAADGGMLPGYMKRGDLAPEYEATIFKLKNGEVSNVVETEFGFHIIQLLDRKGNEFKSRHILMTPKSSGGDVEEAKHCLDSIRLLILNDSITFEKAAKEYSDDKMTGANGGMMLDANGNTRISVNSLDPVVFFTIDTMTVGRISEPLAFRTEDGKEAVRILYYKSKSAPHQANLRDDYQKIYNAALAEKKNKAMNKWFEKNKKELFVEIDEEFSSCNVLN
jgi:peptidyl-prolyl cis-trans isomerase SurA